MAYEYKMVQVPPNIEVKAKDQRGNEAAYYLQSLANEQANEGWEFYRVDIVGVLTMPGCLSALLYQITGGVLGSKAYATNYYVVTFRKNR
jgi:hypothetical protein